MKKSLILLITFLCTTLTYGETVKRVAVTTPVACANTDPIDISIVRGNLIQYISAMPGYVAHTRTDLDQIVREMNFEAGGLVRDADIGRFDALMSGIDILLISEITSGRGRLNVEARFIYRDGGRIGNAISQVMDPTRPEEMERACRVLAERLTGVTSGMAGGS
jgi:hypothetical protein